VIALTFVRAVRTAMIMRRFVIRGLRLSNSPTRVLARAFALASVRVIALTFVRAVRTPIIMRRFVIRGLRLSN